MSDEKYLKWHTVIDGSGCPTNGDAVIVLWDHDTEQEASIAYYDNESKEWFSLNSDTKGDPLIEPDYWIEYPYEQ